MSAPLPCAALQGGVLILLIVSSFLGLLVFIISLIVVAYCYCGCGERDERKSGDIPPSPLPPKRAHFFERSTSVLQQ